MFLAKLIQVKSRQLSLHLIYNIKLIIGRLIEVRLIIGEGLVSDGAKESKE